MRFQFHRVTLLVGIVGALACSDPVGSFVAFNRMKLFNDHAELDALFDSEGGVILFGTLYMPLGDGPHPTIVMVPGEGPQARFSFAGPVKRFVEQGLAVFSYDKRGVGDSDGVCCSDDAEMLASDAVSALQIVRGRPEVDDHRIGYWGTADAGWVIPIAAVRMLDDIQFTVIVSGPTVTAGEKTNYGLLTGDARCLDSGLSEDEVDQRLATQGPSGFDPLPFLQLMDVPGLWMYGALDKSVPVRQSVLQLEAVTARHDKRFTVMVFEGANHQLLQAETGGCWESLGRPRFARGYVNLMANWMAEQVFDQ